MPIETITLVRPSLTAVMASAPSLGGNATGGLKTALAVGAKTPLIVASTVKILAFAHPVGIFGFLAAGIVSVGVYDSIKEYLHGKEGELSLASVLGHPHNMPEDLSDGQPLPFNGLQGEGVSPTPEVADDIGHLTDDFRQAESLFYVRPLVSDKTGCEPGFKLNSGWLAEPYDPADTYDLACVIPSHEPASLGKTGLALGYWAGELDAAPAMSDDVADVSDCHGDSVPNPNQGDPIFHQPIQATEIIPTDQIKRSIADRFAPKTISRAVDNGYEYFHEVHSDRNTDLSLVHLEGENEQKVNINAPRRIYPVKLLGLLAAGIVSAGICDSIKGYLRNKNEEPPEASFHDISHNTSGDLSNGRQLQLNGNDLIHDTATNTTWMQNASRSEVNWRGTGSYIDRNVVGKVISENSGLSNDTPNWIDTIQYSGYHTFGLFDCGVYCENYSTEELVNWRTLRSTVNNSNYIGYDDSNKSRLPTKPELKRLFISQHDAQSGSFSDAIAFIQIQPYGYWSNNQVIDEKAFAYYLGTYYGYQPTIAHKGVEGVNTLPVIYGKINTLPAIPEPEEWVTMILGFGIVGYQVNRKQRKTTSTTA